MNYLPPPVLTQACPNTVTPCFRTVRVFLTIVFAVSIQQIMLFCSFVQATGRVNGGGKVLV